MNSGIYDKYDLNGMISNDILKKEGEFIICGLKVIHNGRGRVIITDSGNEGKVYSDSDYNSPAEVEGIINNIIEVKWGKK